MAETHEEDQEQYESGAWSALPPEILQLIVEKLYLVDRIRFRAVCKEWFLASSNHHEVQPINKQLPWIMTFRFTRTDWVCVLFEPFCRQPYIIEDERNITDDDKIKTEIVEKYLSTACGCRSRSGWVLFSSVGYVVLSPTVRKSVYIYYLYNVLTGKVINVPYFPFRTSTSVLAAFSSDPTSTDCVIFVPEDFVGDQIRICTYSFRDKSWKTQAFSCPDAENYSVEGVVYIERDGSFYCFSKNGLLSSFNVAAEEWKPVTSCLTSYPRPDWFEDLLYGRPSNRFFLEYGGSLIVAYMKFKSGYDYYRPWVGCEVFRFDLTARVWMKMESLEGGALFLGTNTNRVCLGVPAAGENTKTIANRVYYFERTPSKMIGNREYYFSDSPLFITYGGPASRSEEEEEEEEKEGRIMDYSNAWDVQRLHQDLLDDSIWIYHPLLHS